MTLADLRSIRAQRLELESCEERIARLRSAMETLSRRIKSSTSRSTAEHDQLGAQMAKILDLELNLIHKIIAFEDLLTTVEQGLRELPVPQRVVLTLRYVEGLSWDDVAERSHYAKGYCWKLHHIFERGEKR